MPIDKLKARLERIDALRQSILTNPGQRTLVRMLALESEWMVQVIRAQDRVIEARDAIHLSNLNRRSVKSELLEREEAESALAKLLEKEWK